MIPKSLRDWTSAPRVIWHGGRIVARGDDEKTVRELQEALARIGIDPGPIDGLVGWRTRLAHAIAFIRYGNARLGWWEDRRNVERYMRQPEALVRALDTHGCDFVVLDVGRWDDATKGWQAIAVPGEVGELMRHLRRHGIEPHVMCWPLANKQYVEDMGRWLEELCAYERPESVQWDCEGEYFRSRGADTTKGEDALIALSRRLPVDVGATTYPSGIKALQRVLSVCQYVAGQYYEQVDPKRGWDYPPGSLLPGMWGEPEGVEIWCGRAAYRQPSMRAAAESLTIAVEVGSPRISYWSGWWVRNGGPVTDILRRVRG